MNCFHLYTHKSSFSSLPSEQKQIYCSLFTAQNSRMKYSDYLQLLFNYFYQLQKVLLGFVQENSNFRALYLGFYYIYQSDFILIHFGKHKSILAKKTVNILAKSASEIFAFSEWTSLSPWCYCLLAGLPGFAWDREKFYALHSAFAKRNGIIWNGAIISSCLMAMFVNYYLVILPVSVKIENIERIF